MSVVAPPRARLPSPVLRGVKPGEVPSPLLLADEIIEETRILALEEGVGSELDAAAAHRRAQPREPTKRSHAMRTPELAIDTEPTPDEVQYLARAQGFGRPRGERHDVAPR